MSATMLQGSAPLAERLLSRLSYAPETRFETGDYEKPTQQWTLTNALDRLRQDLPELDHLIQGKRVLDYGCGDGFQSVALRRAGAAFVLGVDLNEARLSHGRGMAKDFDRVEFAQRITGHFDVAISLNSFEHFPEPEKNLSEIASSLAPGGKALISFGPPWLSPYGAHMYFFTPVPWVHLLFSEQTVCNVRQKFRSDVGFTYSHDMNRMTLRKFEATVSRCGLRLEKRQYQPVKGLPLVSRVPGIREFLTSQVVAVLAKP